MKTLADYCHCRVCRRATLPVGFLRLCLRLNPRFIFAVGIIAACAAAPNLLARPTANQFPAPVLADATAEISRRVSNRVAQSSNETTVRRQNSRNDCGGKTLLDKIAFIESSNRSACIGDGGAARGAHQLHLAAVLDCGGTRADWIALTNRAVSDKFAGAYIELIKTKLAKAGIKQPSPAQIYQCYNQGFTAAKRTGFDPSKAPKTTRNAIAKL